MEGCGVKVWLQQQILTEMKSPDLIQQFLADAEPQAQHQMAEYLIQTYVAGKDLERARELVTSLGSQNEYPYEAAMQLMRAMGKTQSLERNAIFAQALEAYGRQGESSSSGGGYEGMSGMVLRSWRDVPPSMVIEAIDEILRSAKELSRGSRNLHLTFSGSSGTVALSSLYEYRLFQLLPVLRELDQPRAQSIIEDDPNMKALLARFPQGFRDIRPDYQSHPPKDGRSHAGDSLIMSSGDTPQPAVNELLVEARVQIAQKQGQIIAEAVGDPARAITDAMSLPERPLDGNSASPRADTLLRIAQKLGGKRPNFAKEALAGSRKSLGESRLTARARNLHEIAEEYLRIGDAEDADTTITEAVQVAGALYARDSDSDDPNRVFKGAWPSTNEWRYCVQLAARYSLKNAQAIVAEIRDPEIAALETVYLANALLGASSSAISSGESHKGGQSFEPL
jgi:hypothetical protein